MHELPAGIRDRALIVTLLADAIIQPHDHIACGLHLWTCMRPARFARQPASDCFAHLSSADAISSAGSIPALPHHQQLRHRPRPPTFRRRKASHACRRTLAMAEDHYSSDLKARQRVCAAARAYVDQAASILLGDKGRGSRLAHDLLSMSKVRQKLSSSQCGPARISCSQCGPARNAGSR